MVGTWNSNLIKFELLVVICQTGKIRMSDLFHFEWLIAGGFGSFLLGLNKKTYEQAGIDTEGNTPGSYKESEIGWMIGFMFAVRFVGILTLVPLRKVLITWLILHYSIALFFILDHHNSGFDFVF